MADVRLTATNPADSSVVPVACNEKGELKLEEIPDQSFDGNLEGDLTVSGSAEFEGDVTAARFIASTPAAADNTRGLIDLETPYVSAAQGNIPIVASTIRAGGTYSQFGLEHYSEANKPYLGFKFGAAGVFESDPVIRFGSDGSAEYASQIKAVDIVVQQSNDTFPVFRGLAVNGATTSRINSDGSVVFAGNKAGFTAEGHLWCTTPRGDTVMLTATVGGAGMWEEYNPPSSRRDEIKERWSEKNATRPMPEESSQDEPETPQ